MQFCHKLMSFFHNNNAVFLGIGGNKCHWRAILLLELWNAREMNNVKLTNPPYPINQIESGISNPKSENEKSYRNENVRRSYKTWNPRNK